MGKTLCAVHVRQQNLGASRSETHAAHPPGIHGTPASHSGQVVSDTLSGQRPFQDSLGPLPVHPPGTGGHGS